MTEAGADDENILIARSAALNAVTDLQDEIISSIARLAALHHRLGHLSAVDACEDEDALDDVC